MQADRSEGGNLRGIALMVLAMLAFAFEDSFIKLASEAIPVGPIIAAFGVGGLAVFAGLLALRGEPLITADTWTAPVLVRAACEVVGRTGYYLGIALTPLTVAATILQATPLAVTLGAALVFGEKVGARRWAAILVGFAGVLMVLRPGFSGFTAASLFTVVGMLGFAARDLATRAAAPSLSNLQLAAYGFGVLIPMGLVLTPFTGPVTAPEARDIAFVGVAIGCGAVGYYAITAAMRVGEVGTVSPFRYTRLVFALVLGFAVFGERPDALTLAGGALIVGSGLYTIVRTFRVNRGLSNAGR